MTETILSVGRSGILDFGHWSLLGIWCLNFDELVKSRNSMEFVIPAKAGIQLFQDVLDPGFRRGDDD